MAMGEDITNETATVRRPPAAIQASHLLKLVQESLHFSSKQQQQQRSIPTIAAKDVDIGSLLGSGSFSEVFQVHLPLELSLFDEQHQQQQGHQSEHELLQETPVASSATAAAGSTSNTSLRRLVSMTSCVSTHTTSSHSGGLPKFALKTIRRDFQGDKVMTALGMKDAYFEATILSHLPLHPHICTLVALSEGFWTLETPGFMILERVSETLKHRLVRWSRKSKNDHQNNTLLSSIFQFRKRRRQILHQQRNRLECCAVGIAMALEHLHQHGIVYRDLKPANIGFGYHDGQVKLLDFGLARSIGTNSTHGATPSLRLSGNAGTLRYMAPEVARETDYSLPADVHSFGILLWEICTLERPYGNFSSLEQLSDSTVKSNHRPSQRKIASPAVRQLLAACWDPQPWTRPTMSAVVQDLQVIVYHHPENDSHAAAMAA